MKRLISVFLSVCVLMLIPASAANEPLTVSAPDGYISAFASEDKAELAELFSITEQQLEDYFSENRIIFMAAESPSSEQITVTEDETDFSKSAVSFSRLSDTELNEIGNKLAGSSFSYDGIKKSEGDIKLIQLTLLDTKAAVTREYITVCSGKLYTLRIISAFDIEKISEEVIGSLHITDYASGNGSGIIGAYTVLAAAGIALFSAIGIYLGYTVIRDIKSKRKNSVKSDN